MPYEVLMTINRLPRAEALKAGQTIKVVKGPFHAKVCRSTFTLDVYLQTTFVKSYSVGLGKPGRETPTGWWVVKPGDKLIKPQWTDPIPAMCFEPTIRTIPSDRGGSGWKASKAMPWAERALPSTAPMTPTRSAGRVLSAASACTTATPWRSTTCSCRVCPRSRWSTSHCHGRRVLSASPGPGYGGRAPRREASPLSFVASSPCVRFSSGTMLASYL